MLSGSSILRSACAALLLGQLLAAASVDELIAAANASIPADEQGPGNATLCKVCCLRGSPRDGGGYFVVLWGTVHAQRLCPLTHASFAD